MVLSSYSSTLFTSFLYTFFVFIVHTTVSHPIITSSSSREVFPSVRLLHQFSQQTWLENLVVRANGDVLATVMTAPQLYQLNPSSSNETAEPVLVHEFAGGYLGLLGIVETRRDVFAVVSGNFSLETGRSSPGSYAVWTVDLRGWGCEEEEEEKKTSPLVSKVADVTEAAFLNGMAYLGDEEAAVLLADSDLGVVFRLDLDTGEYRIVIDDPLMKKCSPEVLEGINGLKRYGENLYFTRGFCSLLARMEIHPNGTKKSEETQVIASAPNSTWTFDDFVVDEMGNAFVAVGFNNLVAKFTSQGERSVVAGNLNSTMIAEPTALAFGRTKEDIEKGTVYVTTGGAIGDPIDGSIVVGGQIVAIHLRK